MKSSFIDLRYIDGFEKSELCGPAPPPEASVSEWRFETLLFKVNKSPLSTLITDVISGFETLMLEISGFLEIIDSFENSSTIYPSIGV
jgi:hypothetical protein